MTIRPLSPELSKIAVDELSEVTSRIPEDIQTIQNWLTKQKHIKARTDDQWILAFLRGCKFSLERTKEKIDNYYAIKSLIPELSNGVDPMDPKLLSMLDKGVCLPLLKLPTPSSPRYILMQLGKLDLDDFNPGDLLRLMFMFSCIQMCEDDNATVAGTINIQDLNKISPRYVALTPPLMIKKMVMSRQDAMPMRVKGIRNFNAGFTLETIFNVVKSFLSAKNRSRFFVHAKMDDMLKDIPQDILPKEYGGNGGSIKEIKDYWKSKCLEYREWFLEDTQYRTDESKRPGIPKTAEGMFGVEGSFRKLQVD